MIFKPWIPAFAGMTIKKDCHARAGGHPGLTWCRTCIPCTRTPHLTLVKDISRNNLPNSEISPARRRTRHNLQAPRRHAAT
jgi:hypothetical protein